MNLKSLLGVIIAFSIVFGTTYNASAKDYLTETLTGSSGETGYVKLGDGKRYLKATGYRGNGTVFAMKIVKYLPDPIQTSISVTKGSSASSSFNAVSVSPGGNTQSYYMSWSATTDFKTVAKFTN